MYYAYPASANQLTNCTEKGETNIILILYKDVLCYLHVLPFLTVYS